MAFNPTTFDAHNINDGTTYRAWFVAAESGVDVFESMQVVGEVLGDFPDYVRGQPQGRVIRVKIEVITKAAAAIKTLKQWLNPRQDEKLLKASDGSTTYRVSAKPISLLRNTNDQRAYWVFDASFWVSKPVWENDTQDDSTEQITASAETWVVTNDGSDSVRPRITISPQVYKAATAAPAKQRHIVVANRSPMPLADANGNPYPVEITGGGWDVETKVKAGELHPQGYDLSVYVNGVRVPRYLSNWGAGFGDGDAAIGDAFRTYESAVAFHAMRFRLSGCSEKESNTVDEVAFFLRKVGSPGGSVRARIRNNTSSNTPGGIVTNGTSNTVAASGIGASFAAVSFTFAANPTLNANTWYWLELDATLLTGQSGSAYIELGVSPTTSGRYEGELEISAHSADSTTWYVGADMNGQGTHGAAELFIALAFRVYTTGNAKIWTPMLLPGSVRRTLASAIRSTATEMDLAESDGADPLPDQGAVVVNDEAITYSSKSGITVTFAKRGARGTTSGNHDGADPVYLVDVDVRIVFGHSALDTLEKPTEFEPLALAPVIDGVTSTNERMKWIGPFLAPDKLNRPMAWVPQYDDSVSLADQVSLDMDETNDLTDLTFKDLEAAGRYAKRNSVYQHFPTGIEQAASAITVDVPTIPGALSLQHLLTNEFGEEEIKTTHRASDAGTGKTITPDDETYRYRLRALHGVITGCDTGDAADEALTTSASWAASNEYQSFYLDNPTRIDAIAVRLKKSSGADRDAVLGIFADSSDSPDTTIQLVANQTIATADISTSYADKTIALSTPIELPAGRYWLGVRGNGGSTGTISWSQGTATYSRGNAWDASAHERNNDNWFRLYGEPTQAEMAGGTGNTLLIDNIDIQLDDVTPRTPKVIFQSSDQDCYLLDDAVLENTTTVQTVTLRAIMQTTEELDIDFDAMTVTHSDDDLSRNEHMVAIVDMDEDDPFRLDPGANTLKWTDVGVTDLDIRTRFREPYL